VYNDLKAIPLKTFTKDHEKNQPSKKNLQ